MTAANQLRLDNAMKYRMHHWTFGEMLNLANQGRIKLPLLDILLSSNHNIHKSSYCLYNWVSDPLIMRYYLNLSIKGSEVQKQQPYELLLMLWFDEKSTSKSITKKCAQFSIFENTEVVQKNTKREK